jgi:hypothetical protein
MNKKLSWIFLWFIFEFGFNTIAAADLIIDSQRKLFNQHNLSTAPKKFLNSSMTRSVAAHNHFSPEQIANFDFIKMKYDEWQACRQPNHLNQREIGHRDQLALFWGTKNYLNSLSQMDSRSLKKSILKTKPWSGDYWSISKGILAARSFDDDFRKMLSWPDRFNYVEQNPSSLLFEKFGPAAMSKISPSEKYDLLIGRIVNRLVKKILNNAR